MLRDVALVLTIILLATRIFFYADTLARRYRPEWFIRPPTAPLIMRTRGRLRKIE